MPRKRDAHVERNRLCTVPVPKQRQRTLLPALVAHAVRYYLLVPTCPRFLQLVRNKANEQKARDLPALVPVNVQRQRIPLLVVISVLAAPDQLVRFALLPR